MSFSLGDMSNLLFYQILLVGFNELLNYNVNLVLLEYVMSLLILSNFRN